MMAHKIEEARSWLGSRWLLAEPVNKPVKTARVHVEISNRWHALNQQIARILEGSEHV